MIYNRGRGGGIGGEEAHRADGRLGVPGAASQIDQRTRLPSVIGRRVAGGGRRNGQRPLRAALHVAPPLRRGQWVLRPRIGRLLRQPRDSGVPAVLRQYFLLINFNPFPA